MKGINEMKNVRGLEFHKWQKLEHDDDDDDNRERRETGES